MNLKKNLIQLWKNKGQILEGISNSIFKSEDVEEIAQDRLSICKNCPSKAYSTNGGCMVPGTEPCCDERKGGCGCSLAFKVRSLSSACPLNHWPAILTSEEEDKLNENL